MIKRKIACSLLLAFAGTGAWTYTFEGKVTDVTGPDTFEVLRNKKTEKVTLAGVTVPERYPQFQEKAKNLLFKMLLEKNVTVTVNDTDDDGYKVAYVKLKNGINPAQELLKLGWAQTVKGPHCTREMQIIENSARLKEAGIWKVAGVDKQSEEPSLLKEEQVKPEPEKISEPQAGETGYLDRIKGWWRRTKQSLKTFWEKHRPETNGEPPR
ncbi:MAG: thermonuclease family protein [Elusimicrobiaceae bacterium]